ncbi:PrsW family glutamic-type intramembrane protease [Lachnospiraceae bacterium 46-15]
MNHTFFYKAANLSEDFSWKDVFSDVMKPHTKEQRGKVLVRGISGYVPEPSKMLEEWQKPWLFLRFGVIGILLSVLAVFIWNIFGGFLRGLDFSVYLITAFFPLIMVVMFFWEMNIPGTISIFEMVFLMLLGGLLSMMGTGNLHLLIPDIPQALQGPLPEEIAKFTVICVLMSLGKYKYGLEGVLAGCAIGAGFGAIETAGYGLSTYNTNYSDAIINWLVNTWSQNPQLSSREVAGIIESLGSQQGEIMAAARTAATNILVLRACLAFGGHVLWGAMYGGALGLAKKGTGKLKLKSFADPLVILSLLGAFVLHTLWNLNPVQLLGMLPEGMVVFLGKCQQYYIYHGLLIIVGWLILLRILRKCIRQIVAVSQRAAAIQPETPILSQPGVSVQGVVPVPFQAAGQAILTVTAIGEIQSGKRYHLTEGGSLVFGRSSGQANVVFSQDTKGVSNIHCEIKVKQGYPVLIDRKSSYGTFFSNGQRLEPNVPYKLQNHVKFYLASEKYKFEIKM